MKSQSLFTFMMIALLLVFGTHWNCTIEVDHNRNDTKNSSSSAESQKDGGCAGPQPIHVQGSPQHHEFTVMVGIFRDNDRGEAKAIAISSKLRKQRIKNYVYQQQNSCWVVSIGRFIGESKAKKMKNLLISRGFTDASIHRPLTGGGDANCEP